MDALKQEAFDEAFDVVSEEIETAIVLPQLNFAPRKFEPGTVFAMPKTKLRVEEKVSAELEDLEEKVDFAHTVKILETEQEIIKESKPKIKKTPKKKRIDRDLL